MTNTEFCAALETLGWPQRELARRLSVSERWVRRRANGEADIDDDLAAWLRRAAAWIAAHPVPTRAA